MKHDNTMDKQLSQLYKAGATEQPPARLDKAILDHARREVTQSSSGSGVAYSPFSSFTRSWFMPFSLTAVLVVVVSLAVLVAQKSPDLSSTLKSDTAQRSRSETTPSPTQPTIAPKSQSSISEPIDKETKRTEPSLERTPSQPAELQTAPSADSLVQNSSPPRRGTLAKKREARVGNADQSLAESKKESFATQEDASSSMPPTSSPPQYLQEQAKSNSGFVADSKPSAAASKDFNAQSDTQWRTQKLTERETTNQSAPASIVIAPEATKTEKKSGKVLNEADTAKQKTQEVRVFDNPKEWLEYIEQLRKQGKLEETEKSLIEFKKRFPSYPLPANFLR